MSYAMQNGLTLEKIVADLKANFTEEGSMNLKGLALDFEPIGKEDFLKYFNGSWKHTFLLVRLNDGVVNMKSKRIGTFFMKTFQFFVTVRGAELANQLLLPWNKKLDETFVLPKQKVSLQNIVQLYATLNPDLLSSEHKGYVPTYFDDHFEIKLLEDSLPEFVSCFNTVLNESEDLTETGFYDETNLKAINQSKARSLKLPCEEDQFVRECENYCNWHSNFFKSSSKEEFLTIMKYSLPQPRILFDSHIEQEQALAKRMFGVSNVGNLSHRIAPNAMPIFCFSKLDGYRGDEIGLSTKVCNEFKHMPSDIGISISNNKVNPRKILQIGKPYEAVFETDDKKNDVTNIEGGNYWSQKTYVFNTGFDNVFENIIGNKESDKLEDVLIQLH